MVGLLTLDQSILGSTPSPAAKFADDARSFDIIPTMQRPEINIGQIDLQGRMGPILEACILRAERTFLNRAPADTNPAIVRMVLRGVLIDHWYYRSCEWIEQPYFAAGILLQPYVGSAKLARPKSLYGAGTYITDIEATEDARFLLENPEYRTLHE